MTPASAASIGRTLSRLGHLKPSEGESGAGQSSREAIHAVIAEADEAVSIDRICSATGLHANTVRPHLDVLLALGRIAREHGQREGRGRPPWLYRAVETAQERERRRLAGALLEQLQEADTSDLARDAARRWAEQRGRGSEPAEDPDAAVADAAEAMSGLGFQVSVTPVGDRIDLMGCPYADLVADRPIICDIHGALLQQLLETSGQPVELERLEVYPRPGICTAHLRRADQRPVRSITMRSPE